MRILHTSDWHLNDRLGSINRQKDIVERLKEIARYLKDHKVDVMVVSGDLFSQYTRLEDIRDAINDVNGVFKPFLLDGGTIIAISGNHDNEALFEMMRTMLDLASPIDPQNSGVRPRGRLYLVTQPTYLLLEDKTGQQVQFVLMPYPTSARYLRDEDVKYKTLEERNSFLHAAMVKRLQLFKEKHVKAELPSVLVTHIHIRGAQTHTLYRITEREDVVFDPIDIPINWAYVACGHIHKPQAVSGASHVRYSGSIDRMDYGEVDDDKSVVLVDISNKGLEAEPLCLPLNATPIYRVEINNPDEEIPLLKDKYPNHLKALVSWRLQYKPSQHNKRDQYCRELDAIFPLCYRREVIMEEDPDNLINKPLINRNIRDIRSTVENYLQLKLVNSEQFLRDGIIEAAEQLLLEMEK